MNIKLLLLLIPFILVATAAGIYGSYRQQVNRPSHSLKVIRAAIANHDWETFQKYVDVENIISASADELLAERMEQDKSAYSMNQLAETYEQQIKPEFQQTVLQAFQDYIERGRIRYPEGAQLTDTQRMIKQAGINSIHLDIISKAAISGGEATVLLDFSNDSEDLAYHFELMAHLKDQGDGTWKITGITGLKDFLDEVKRARKAKLDRLNSPIRDKLEDIMNIKSIRADIVQGDEYGFSELLRMQVRADIQSEKPLAKISGRIRIDPPDDEDETELYAPFELDMAFKPLGVQTFPVDKVLNPFVKADVKIMRQGLRRDSLHPEVTGVVFQDGTKLELMTALPDEQ